MTRGLRIITFSCKRVEPLFLTKFTSVLMMWDLDRDWLPSVIFSQNWKSPLTSGKTSRWTTSEVLPVVHGCEHWRSSATDGFAASSMGSALVTLRVFGGVMTDDAVSTICNLCSVLNNNNNRNISNRRVESKKIHARNRFKLECKWFQPRILKFLYKP